MLFAPAWLLEAPGFFTAAFMTFDACGHMTAERLPDGGWDWVVWPTGRADCCRSGVADTAHHAMLAAEHAAQCLCTVYRVAATTALSPCNAQLHDIGNGCRAGLAGFEPSTLRITDIPTRLPRHGARPISHI